ncbi:MAG: hypothetical protein BMS9Abin26_0954 [Gammaproteobacteria bacterium]|nr:MAG: hypothetical protein BMS9Abin26_0954 [Gammaproteobacteria bacterium]
MTRTNIIVSIVLFVLVGLTGWLQNVFEVSDTDNSGKESAGGIDYYMEDFTITSMNAEGIPGQELTASKMVHYSEDDSTELTKPHFTVFKKSSAPWHIVADRGWLSADSKNILLKGGVVIDRPADKDNGTMRMTTSELRIRTEDEYAETDKPVLMITDATTTQAGGLRLYLKQGKMHLTGNVRGKYAK